MNADTFKQTHFDAIFSSYLETLIWQGHDWDDQDESGNPSSLDRFSNEDFDAHALASSREDLEGFIDQAFETLGEDAFKDLEPQLIGHNFALSRNGHGAGFFDSGARFANELQDLCRPWGEVNLYVFEVEGEEKLGIH